MPTRGGYDDGLPAELATPGYGVRPEFDHDFSFHFGLPYVLVAAVNGAAAGVGLAVALFCDLRFVSATAKLTTAAPRLGLPAEYGMSWMLPRLIGVTRANDLLLSGRVVTGADTADWGLWNGVLPDGEATLAEARATRPRSRRPSDRPRCARRSGRSTTTCSATTSAPHSSRRAGCSSRRWARRSIAKVSPHSRSADPRSSDHEA